MPESTRSDYSAARVEAMVDGLRPLVASIAEDLADGVAIYGAGFLGSWAREYLVSRGAKVSCFVDMDESKIGTELAGVEIVAPGSQRAHRADSMLIAARHAVAEVTESMGDKVPRLLSFDGYFVVENYDRLAAVRDGYLEDPKSVEVFNALLVSMLTGSVESCRAVMEKDMYFSLPEFAGNFDETFVDAGAFVGDTVERFLWENLGTYRQLYAFEPGPKQFAALSARMKRLREEWALDESSIHLERAGLAAENGRMGRTFVGDSPIRHGLAELDGAVNEGACEVYSLDRYLDGRFVSFIKADIEGMEMDLLRGARETIQKWRPKMALCAYHYPSDLYEIAELVRELVPEYRFSLRQHAPIFGDFVLYCYP